MPRNAVRGKKVFELQCVKCHKISGQGFEVGPDLSVTKTRADETLISDVMDPSSVLTVGYRNYNVLTADGRIFNGVLTAETATSVTLRKEEGVEQTILRKDIDEMMASPISMMPEDLEKVVAPQDVADLLAFLREATAQRRPSPCSRGSPCSRIKPPLPRRCTKAAAWFGFTRKILTRARPAWRSRPRSDSRRGCRIGSTASPKIPAPASFATCDSPGSRGGEGIMLELAAEGDWPPANEAIRRYYSGQNTTGWVARQVASEAPQQLGGGHLRSVGGFWQFHADGNRPDRDGWRSVLRSARIGPFVE